VQLGQLSDQPAHDGRREDRAAIGHLFDRVNEVVGRVALQEEPARSGPECRDDGVVAIVVAQHDDAGRARGTNLRVTHLLRGLQAFGSLDGGVEEHDIGA
jgi:hypothetical protein